MPSNPLLSLACVGSLVLLSAGAYASAKPNASKMSTRAIEINAWPIRSFAKSGDSDSRYGRLRFRGGLVLRSPDAAFGGFSGLEISPDGTKVFAVTDAGSWLKADLKYTGKRLTGIGAATTGPILALGKKRLTRGRDRDAEAVRLLKGNLDSGTVLVGFERNQRIGFFKLSGGEIASPQRYIRPPIRLRSNKGIESTGVIRAGARKGTIVAFAERTLDTNGHHRGWMWQGKKVHPLALTNIGGFDITDVAGSPDGGLYVLERRFRWSEGIRMRIRRIGAKAIKPGAVLNGEMLLTADLGYEIDNMEGLSVHQDKSKRTMLTMISDNNFNSFLQRTVLLQFEVEDN